MSVHIGKEIYNILEERRMSPALLCKKIGMHDRTVYQFIKKPYLHTELLLKISKALDTNLFLLYISPEDFPQNNDQQSRIDELEEQVESQQKELDYLKEINQLLREKS